MKSRSSITPKAIRKKPTFGIVWSIWNIFLNIWQNATKILENNPNNEYEILIRNVCRKVWISVIYCLHKLPQAQYNIPILLFLCWWNFCKGFLSIISMYCMWYSSTRTALSMASCLKWLFPKPELNWKPMEQSTGWSYLSSNALSDYFLVLVKSFMVIVETLCFLTKSSLFFFCV